MQPLALYACHCKECQRQSSSAFGLSMTVPKQGVQLHASTEQARRADPNAPPVVGEFCPNCGSRLLHHRAGRETLNIKPGTLDITDWVVPVGHVWTRSSMRGFKPTPGELVFDQQPNSYQTLIEAWKKATEG
jgi:hypothetical protein